jgi:hypothetical protein
MRIWLKNTWGGTALPNNYDGGIDLFSPHARMQLSGLLGLASLPDGANRAAIAHVDMNLEGMGNFRVSPPPDGDNYLAYSAALRLGDLGTSAWNTPNATLASGRGSYFSLAEPGMPQADLSFENITGDLTLERGRLALRAAGERGPEPTLTLSNEIRLGASATARINDAHAGAPLPGPSGSPAGSLVRSDVYFGDDRLGEVIIPAATQKSSITLLPPP